MDTMKCGHQELVLANRDIVLDEDGKRSLITRRVTLESGLSKVPKVSEKAFKKFMQLKTTRPEPLHDFGSGKLAYIYKTHLESIFYEYMIGIDPGVLTGYAKVQNGKLTCLSTPNQIKAQKLVLESHQNATQEGKRLKVLVEDARLRTWFGSSGKEKFQGAGDIKRQCAQWEEFCIHHGIDYVMVKPGVNRTKVAPETFKKITGWKQRCSNHARDAAMMVFGRTHYFG